MQNRRLNLHLDGHKIADKRYRESLLCTTMDQPLPKWINNQAHCSPVKDQGQEGSCSGFATIATVEFLQIKELREKIKNGPLEYDICQFDPLSEHFVYYGERDIEGSAESDSGATTLADANTVITTLGVPREITWPYSTDTLYVRPSTAAYAEASEHKLPFAYALETEYERKHCLASGFVFHMGFMVPADFQSAYMEKRGFMPDASWKTSIEGGHAVNCVGYDDGKQAYLCKNSWGQHWGFAGYFWMPYWVMNDQTLANDQYTLRENEITP